MRYSWKEGSPIQEVVVSVQKKAAPEAVIFAPKNAAFDGAGLEEALVQAGYATSYDVIDNRPVLRVGGFRNEADITTLLEQKGLVSGAPQISALPNEKKGFDRLMGSAFSYQLGNLIGWIGNWFRGDKAGLISDTAFLVGDSTLIAFGKKSGAEKQLAIMQGFGEILQIAGIAPDAASPFGGAHVEDKPGIWNATRRFMADKVIAVKSVSEVTAGLMKARAGFSNQGNPAKGTAGLLIASGFASGLLIKEKTDAELREEYGAKDTTELNKKLKAEPFFTRMVTAIQRTPLIFSGLFSGLNNIFTIWGAIDERNYFKEHKKSRKQEELEVKLNGGDYHSWSFGATKTTTVETGAIAAASDAQSTLTKAEKMWNRTNFWRRAGLGLFGKPIDYKNEDKYKELATTQTKAWEKVEDLTKELHAVSHGRYGADATIKPQHFWMFDVAQQLLFAVGNVLYGSSPKGGSLADRQKLSDRFFAAVASEIARAPDDTKDYLFAAACQYAGETRDLGVNTREAQGILNAKLQQLEENPWLRARKNAPPVAAQTKVPAELLNLEDQQDRTVQKAANDSTAKIVESFADTVGKRSLLPDANSIPPDWGNRLTGELGLKEVGI